MGDFLFKFAEWLREFVPFKIIRADEQGSLHILGRAAGTLQPGWHWYLPVRSEIRVYNVAYQQIELTTQALPTSDDVPVVISANVGYTIFDAQAMDVKVQDFDTTLRLETMGWIATKVGECTYDELRTNRRATQYELKRSLAALVKEWGVDIKNVRLTDLAKTRSYRIFGDAAASQPRITNG